MFNKYKTNIIFVIVIAFILVLGFLYHKSVVNSLESKLLNIETKQLKELRITNDSLLNNNQELINRTIFILDSISNLKPKIKYVPYEKPVYIDRSIDDNLDILARD